MDLNTTLDAKLTQNDLLEELYRMAKAKEDQTTVLQFLQTMLSAEDLRVDVRLKVSTLLIKYSNFEMTAEVLLPVINSSGSTFQQQQKAFNHLSLSENRLGNPEQAEIWCRRGIDLDGIGCCQLWENLIDSLRAQYRFDELLIVEGQLQRYSQHPGFHVCLSGCQHAKLNVHSSFVETVICFEKGFRRFISDIKRKVDPKYEQAQ